jgi:hypothetical protein
LNGPWFLIGLLASLAGGTIAVLGFRRKLDLRATFGDHTALGGVVIQILGIIMIVLSQT